MKAVTVVVKQPSKPEKVGMEQAGWTVVQGEWVVGCVLPCFFQTGRLEQHSWKGVASVPFQFTNEQTQNEKIVLFHILEGVTAIAHVRQKPSPLNVAT